MPRQPLREAVSRSSTAMSLFLLGDYRVGREIWTSFHRLKRSQTRTGEKPVLAGLTHGVPVDEGLEPGEARESVLHSGQVGSLVGGHRSGLGHHHGLGLDGPSLIEGREEIAEGRRTLD